MKRDVIGAQMSQMTQENQAFPQTPVEEKNNQLFYYLMLLSQDDLTDDEFSDWNELYQDRINISTDELGKMIMTKQKSVMKEKFQQIVP